MDILLKATGVPIDHYSYEAVEQLKDIAARWNGQRKSAAWPGAIRPRTRPSVRRYIRRKRKSIPIDVSFAQLKDDAEREYLNQQPTSFFLPPEAVDRLRAAAGTIILAHPEFQRLLKDLARRSLPAPPAGAGNAPGAPH